MEFESLRNHIPRALAARDTVHGSWGSTDGFIGYVAQEKLDGVFVLWSGNQLYTKTGMPITHDRLRDWLPPFPFVGELCTGRGSPRSLPCHSSRKRLPADHEWDAQASREQPPVC